MREEKIKIDTLSQTTKKWQLDGLPHAPRNSEAGMMVYKPILFKWGVSLILLLSDSVTLSSFITTFFQILSKFM